MAPLDIPPLTCGQEVTVRAKGSDGVRMIHGTVRNIDPYGDDADACRVVTIVCNPTREMDSDEWVDWKAFLVEEPEGEYRVNLLESDGGGSRTVPLHDVIGFER